MNSINRIIGLLIGGLLWQSSAWASDWTEQAKQLAALRSEVQALSAELELQRSSLRNRLRSLETQKADLELQLRRESLQAQAILDRKSEREAALATAKDEALEPLLVSLAEELKASVASSISFRKSERLDAIDGTMSDLRAQKITSTQALTRLWSALEDERRMGSEIQLERMVIPINGTEQMLNVVRLGRVTAFYQQQEGGYGVLLERDGRWQWEVLHGHDEALDTLFLSISRGIRGGRFLLPQFWME
ncbi:MAG: DUF3450 family protein [Myxococcota bacterium]|nr:DUF3450 family protein [Myxococcota bacterium]